MGLSKFFSRSPKLFLPSDRSSFFIWQTLKSGPCPFFREGQEIIVDGDNFFRMLHGTFCAEAWDCISRYVYAALQGGSIMRGWTNDEKVMITCCNDGTRPVIFKLERMDEEE